jgi:hypothetical protein
MYNRRIAKGKKEERGEDGKVVVQIVKGRAAPSTRDSACNPPITLRVCRRATVKYDDSGRGDIIWRNKQSRNPGRINQ